MSHSNNTSSTIQFNHQSQKTLNNHSDALKPGHFDELWSDLFESLPHGIMLLTNERELLYANNKMRELWEIPEAIVSGAQFINSIISKIEDSESYVDRVSQNLTETSGEEQEKIKLKNGKVFLRISNPLIIRGETIGRSWTFRDITNEFLAEQSIRENELKYKELYDHAERTNKKLSLIDRIRNSAIESADQADLIKNLVEGLADTFGYSLVQFYVLQQSTLRLVHSVGFERGSEFDEMTLDQGVIGRTARTQKPIFVEDVRTDPDFLASTSNVMSELSFPVFDRNELFGVLNIESKFDKLTENDFSFISGICEQVSGTISRVRLYNDVLTQEKQLQRIFDFSPIGVVICALDGTFLEVNQAFEKLIGYQIEELRHFKFKDLTHPDEVDNNLQWTRRLVEGEIATYGFEKRYIHKNGSFINALLQVSILPTPKSKPNQLIAQVIDLTQLKQAETALMQHQKLESIGVLAGGIAHDFNNLLVAMKAQSSLALRKLPIESAAKKHIEKANQAADSAAQLTTQLLAYSGQGQFKIEQIDLNSEVEQNTQLLTVAIPKNVAIQTNLEENLPQIMVDKGQLQQVLMNLIINGAEAMEGNSGQITISTGKAYLSLDKIDALEFTLMPPAPGPFIQISIADNGQGMEKETVQKIFDPFFTTKFTGRGLGLAAVLGIVRSHNGGLVVNSQPERGTNFRIFFPTAANQTNGPSPEPIENKESISEPEPEKTANSNKKVLLIDDDDMVRETLSDLLQLEGIPIVSAANGTEGIEQFKKHKQDVAVVILDLAMPGISSEETFTQLRDIRTDLPVLLCSGFSQAKVNEFFAQKDHNGFIAKPFELESLIKKVRKFL